jgi:ankyrin repeat protein
MSMDLDDFNDILPLHHCHDLRTVKAMLLLGADPHATDSIGMTALHHCRVPAIAEALIAAGADPNARDDWQRTPLFHMHNDVDVVRVLLSAGADPTLTDARGDQPLVSTGPDVADLLLANDPEYLSLINPSARTHP